MNLSAFKPNDSLQLALLTCFLLISFLFDLNECVNVYDSLRYSPYSSFFNNPYDYADAETYGSTLFSYLYQHLNDVKKEQCKNIPVPKTVLNQKYFNPDYEFMDYKHWYPPKDHQYVLLWSQYEAYRNSLFLSYMLQDNNAKFPPGWLYMYLSTAAQLHSMQSIGFNSHKIVKGIKLPFESNEVFKVNWWTDGHYLKLEKAFALYATQPRPNDLKFVRVIDFGTGNYSNDYTGHGFISNYVYERYLHILNNTFEYSKAWKRPFQFESTNDQTNKLNFNSPFDTLFAQQQQQQRQNSYARSSFTGTNNNYGSGSPMSPQGSSFGGNSGSSGVPRADGLAPFLQQYPQQQYPAQSIKTLYSDREDQMKNAQNKELLQQEQLQQQQFQQQQQYYDDPSKPYQQNAQQQLPFDTSYLQFYHQEPVSSLSDFSPFIYINKNNVPIESWDPVIDHNRNNLNRVPDRNSPIGFDQWYIESIVKNSALDSLKSSQQNPFNLKPLKYIETYRYAKPWWKNETHFMKNKQEYVFRIKPDESYYKFVGAKYEDGVSWSSPYFWCIDPTNWLATVMSPIWASNDYEYKNKLFVSTEPYRFVGLSEVVLNYEEVDINQCPGDRQLNAFSSTSLCDSTTRCKPVPFYGLSPGGYECECQSGFHFPSDFQGPFRGRELGGDLHTYPLCPKSHNLVQYPTWISKSAIEYPIPNTATSALDYNFNMNIKKKRDVSLAKLKFDKRKASSKLEKSIEKLLVKKKKAVNSTSESTTTNKRQKRFIDKRNNFEKLRDSIFIDQDLYRRRCQLRPFQDIIYLNEDDELFTSNLRYHADQVFKAQTAQAIRIAHILSAYLQLHSPTITSSVNLQNEYGKYKNFGKNLRPDPQLEEQVIVGELISTLQANHPIQEVNVFFNATEFKRQKFYSSQDTLGFGLSMIRSDVELILNKSNDHSHLNKTWYLDAIKRFMYGGGRTVFGGPYANMDEKQFYEQAGPFDINALQSQFRIDRYGIEMSLRSSFDGFYRNNELAAKFYDAASSGVWFGPYYDCQKRYMKSRNTLRMIYSVPIVTSLTKYPVGFVSVGLGSDLKWWKINPCETSKERNMFQNVHRCDIETTICMQQEVPEFENGYYLASYKCICKANYEFPFIDYGSSFFEGGTVEREYDKKLKGQPNIYDRLKCRPIMPKNTYGTNYWNSMPSIHKSSFSFTISILFFVLYSVSSFLF